MSRLKIDFYKEFKLPPTLCGMVNLITSPKGNRKYNDEGFYEYHLKTELIQTYDSRNPKPAYVEPGIYWVMNICRGSDGQLTWNHYLIVVNEEAVFAVAEFLNAEDSSWIREALPYIKKYYKEEPIPPIKIDPYKPPKKVKKTWNTKY